MTLFNREFLVPYLHDICSLYLAQEKLKTKYNHLSRMVGNIDKYSNLHKPQKNSVQDHSMSYLGFFLSILLLILGGAFLLVGKYGQGSNPERLIDPGFAVLMAGAAIFLLTSLTIVNAKKEAQIADEKFRHETEVYEREVSKENQQKRIQIARIEQERKQLYSEINKLERLIQKSFSVNVIPRQYRNIYASVYLYDWFSSSRANDLDMALNTFVLEEIKAKLDTIIENQADMIINQRIMMANQQKSLEEQQRHTQMMQTKLSRIAASNDERNVYLGMIESNTAATAYFAAANYFRNL